ncbi:hypothetical protein KEM52_001419, partial [Ascosphaera acerosa]
SEYQMSDFAPNDSMGTGPAPEVTQKAEVVEKLVERDPYDDLDPFYKSSLSRLVSMLRQEMAAESDEAKYRIFANCVIKETRLRKALYEVQDQPKPRRKEADDMSPQPQDRRRASHQADNHQQAHQNESSQEVPSEPSSSKQSSPASATVSSSKTETPSISVVGADSEQQSTDPARTAAAADAAHTPASQESSESGLAPAAVGTAPNSAAAGSPKRVYTPFRYSPITTQGRKTEQIELPKAYLDLRHEYNGGMRILSGSLAPPPLRPGSARPTQNAGDADETFLSVVRAKSVAYKKFPRMPKQSTHTSASQSILQTELAELRSAIPDPLPGRCTYPLADEIGSQLDMVDGNFGWIKDLMRKWDENQRSVRLQLVSRRQQRLAEASSPSMSDEADGDAGDMTQVEAQKQLTEERRGYEDFQQNVYKPVEKRLSESVETLSQMQESITSFFNSEDIVGYSYHGISVLMGYLLTIFNKLESNYEERVRSSIDLERRRAQAERVFFVALGDQQSLLQLDHDFKHAERQAALTAARERNRRTNDLMDIIDSMSSAGLGANQSLLDDLSARVQHVATRIKELEPQEGALTDEAALKDASAVIRYLAIESENIVQYLSVAEANLNNSDYDLSTWQARVRGASQEDFSQMRREKREEDAKLAGVTNSRIADIQREYNSVIRVVKEARELLRSQLAKSQRTTASVAPCEPLETAELGEPLLPQVASSKGQDTQERLRKALDEAKRRNAAKFGST